MVRLFNFRVINLHDNKASNRPDTIKKFDIFVKSFLWFALFASAACTTYW
jgi:hypothetical protein